MTVLWQATENSQHSLGWGSNLLGSEGSVWLAGGDASCAADSKVFDKEKRGIEIGEFRPNHRGNWVDALRSEQLPTMPLTEAAFGFSLARAGELAWRLDHQLFINVDKLKVMDDEAVELDSIAYAEPWTPKI